MAKRQKTEAREESLEEMGVRMEAENAGVASSLEEEETLTGGEGLEEEEQADIPGPEEEPEEEVEEEAEEEVEEKPAAEADSGGEEEDPDAWKRDPALLEFADSIGLPREDVGEFESFEELQRHARLIDRRQIQQRRQQYQQQQYQQQQYQQPPPRQAPRRPSGPPKIDPDLLDEETAAAFKSRDQYYEAKIQQLESQFTQQLAWQQQQALDQELSRFNEVLDGIGSENLFGRFGKLVPGSVEARNRERVLNAYAYLNNRQPTEAMVRRALNQEFWKELNEENSSARHRKIRKQSKRVLRDGVTRSARSKDSEPDHTMGVSDADDRELKRLAYRMMLGQLK